MAGLHRKSRYRGWFGRRARRRCPHTDLHPIYGDRINHVGGWRLWCEGCQRYIDGDVAIAARRQKETTHV